MESLSFKSRLCRLFVGIAVISAGLVQAAETSTVRRVSVSAVPGGTRIEVALDGPQPTATLFTLAEPDRVVLDLGQTVMDPKQASLPSAAGLVRHLRYGPRDGATRLVFEVEPSTTAHRVDAPAGRIALLLNPPDVTVSRPEEPPAVTSAAAAAVPAPVPPEHIANESMPARPVAARSASSPARPNGRTLVIAVDAGHGGEDPGASGPDGTHEKDVTLAIARELSIRINAEPGMRAVLTRPDDRFVPLRERIHRARRAQADLFVSVHADAVPDHSVSGASVYVLSARGASSEAAKWLADRENAADLVGGVSLDDKDNVLASVLLDLSQSAAMSASMVAAEKVLTELNSVGDVRKARVQQAGFVVLKSPDIPSMLIETAYITNPGEEKRLRDERYQQKLAAAILSGIRGYFRDSPLPGTRLAALGSERSPESHTR